MLFSRLADKSVSDGKRVQFANTLRGLACMMVVFAHYGQLYWVAPETVSLLTGLPTAATSATPAMPAPIRWTAFIPWVQWGNLGVAIFFLISGFVIPFSLAQQSPRQFIISRTLRIVPTYMAGFPLTVATIVWGCYFFGVPLPFHWSEAAQHSIPGLRDLLKIRPIDGIVWTLEIEIKFYVLCALTSHWFRVGSTKVFLVPLILGLVAIALAVCLPSFSAQHPRLARWSLLWITNSQYVIFMYAGVAFHFYKQRSISLTQMISSTIALLALCSSVWYCGPSREVTSIPVNYAIAIVVFSLAALNAARLRGSRLTDFISSISYPLYVVHGVAGYVLLRVLQEQNWQPIPSLALTLSVAIAAAWLLHCLIEVPTQKLGKRLARQYAVDT